MPLFLPSLSSSPNPKPSRSCPCSDSRLFARLRFPTMRSLRLFAFPILSILLMAFSYLGQAQAQDLASSPAPPPSSDGTAVDQGIAYFLMVVALAITYLFH
ncbi:arabinogalactan protein 22-like [Prosopis cineraria]|uniref:arabinogalactan protein 22-like n=1 Tax=Prosopis cineraria TaxID=364024 RepID=UPI00240EA86F|nr:arabinogalactan protein 22-like [Prosopis cineraria]